MTGASSEMEHTSSMSTRLGQCGEGSEREGKGSERVEEKKMEGKEREREREWLPNDILLN